MNKHIAEIRQALAEGRKLWGGQMMIDEERFYIATTKLRKSVPPSSVQQIAKYLDTVEGLIENSKGRLAGKAVVRPADFEPGLRALEAALKALPPSEQIEQAPPSAELTIEAARLEAARIIEEAHREADEIRRRAR